MSPQERMFAAQQFRDLAEEVSVQVELMDDPALLLKMAETQITLLGTLADVIEALGDPGETSES